MIKDENKFTIRPNPDWILEKKWYCRIYLFGYDRIEANFITKAIQDIDDKAVEFSVDEEIEIISKQIITVDYVNNFYKPERNIDVSVSHAGFTNKNLDYLYWKDPENEIFMLFGSKKFVETVMPVTVEEYQKYYEEFYENWMTPQAKSLLKRLWVDYPNSFV